MQMKRILFDAQGHLTHEALCTAVSDTTNAILDDLARLEIAEHLSFCDNCLVRYTAMLTDDMLLTPQHPIAPPVLQRIRRKLAQTVFNKYTTYAAAAGFALVLWGTGVFGALSSAPGLAPSPQAPPLNAAVEKDEGFLRGLNNTLGDVFFKVNQTIFGKPPAEKSLFTK